MDSWIALAALVAAVVILEVVGARAYRRYRARRQDPLSRPAAEPVAESLEGACGYLARAQEALREALEAARAEGAAAALPIVEALLGGTALQRERLEALLGGGEAPEAPSAPGPSPASEPVGLARAMARYAEQAAPWAFDVAPAAADQARRLRCREAAKALRIVGEVEGCHAEVAEAIAAGALDEVHEVSLCPSCGMVAFGRRPAFCTACGQPGFEMQAVRKGLLD